MSSSTLAFISGSSSSSRLSLNSLSLFISTLLISRSSIFYSILFLSSNYSVSTCFLNSSKSFISARTWSITLFFSSSGCSKFGTSSYNWRIYSYSYSNLSFKLWRYLSFCSTLKSISSIIYCCSSSNLVFSSFEFFGTEGIEESFGFYLLKLSINFSVSCPKVN